MSRNQYVVSFPKATPGDEVTWPNAVQVFADAQSLRPLASAVLGEGESPSATLFSDAVSVAFTCPRTGETLTCTTGSPSQTGGQPSGGGDGAYEQVFAASGSITKTGAELLAQYNMTAADFASVDFQRGSGLVLGDLPGGGGAGGIQLVDGGDYDYAFYYFATLTADADADNTRNLWVAMAGGVGNSAGIDSSMILADGKFQQQTGRGQPAVSVPPASWIQVPSVGMYDGAPADSVSIFMSLQVWKTG